MAFRLWHGFKKSPTDIHKREKRYAYMLLTLSRYVLLQNGMIARGVLPAALKNSSLIEGHPSARCIDYIRYLVI
jgi:hypothetical protein